MISVTNLAAQKRVIDKVVNNYINQNPKDPNRDSSVIDPGRDVWRNEFDHFRQYGVVNIGVRS